MECAVNVYKLSEPSGPLLPFATDHKSAAKVFFTSPNIGTHSTMRHFQGIHMDSSSFILSS